MQRLLTDRDGKVTGAEIGEGASHYFVDAQKVILATNGFGANRALIREFCPDIADAQYFGATSAQGEAIQWGRELGAALGNTGSY